MASQSFIMIPPAEARQAAAHFAPIHGITPILPLERVVRDGVTLNVFGKFENVQSMSTFKSRGAEWFTYLMMRQFVSKTGRFRVRGKSPAESESQELPELVGASAGNHAGGAALAGKRYGLKVTMFMPEGTPLIKRKKVELLGADVKIYGRNFDETLERAIVYCGKNSIFIPPFENPSIMAGQGSVAVEILSKLCPYHPDYLKFADYDWPTPDVFICGLGGGGLASGIGSVVKEFNAKSGKNIRVIGVQSEAADAMYKSIKLGMYHESTPTTGKTVAEGIAVKRATNRMIATVGHYVDQVVLVSERDIVNAIAYVAQHPDLRGEVWHTHERFVSSVPYRQLPPQALHVHDERPLNRVEGAGAAPYAAILFGDKFNELRWRDIAQGRPELSVYCILTGANIDDTRFAKINSRRTRPDVVE